MAVHEGELGLLSARAAKRWHRRYVVLRDCSTLLVYKSARLAADDGPEDERVAIGSSCSIRTCGSKRHKLEFRFGAYPPPRPPAPFHRRAPGLLVLLSNWTVGRLRATSPAPNHWGHNRNAAPGRRKCAAPSRPSACARRPRLTAWRRGPRGIRMRGSSLQVASAERDRRSR